MERMSTPDNENSSQASSATSSEEATQPTVLLTDDENDFRETLRLWLTQDGRWTVLEASDGEEALAKLDPGVDVLVLDREMPRLSGPDVVRRLPDHSFDGDVVVVSARRPDPDLNSEMVADYLTKPLGRQQFLETLERHV